jgi:hypothetical protein
MENLNVKKRETFHLIFLGLLSLLYLKKKQKQKTLLFRAMVEGRKQGRKEDI